MNNRVRNRAVGLLVAVVGVSGVLVAVGMHQHHPSERVATKASVDDTTAVKPKSTGEAAPMIQHTALDYGVATEAEEPKHPTEAPPVEPPEVIETMTETELRETVADINKQLLEKKAVERLNTGAASETERAEFGSLMHRYALMQGQIARLALGDLEREVAEYEKGHDARVAKYVGRRAN